MVARRVLGVVAVVLVLAPVVRAQTYTLSEAPKEGDCFRYKLEMKLTGEIRVTKEDKQVPIPLSATATHEFPERILSVGASGRPDRTARVYEKAKTAIAVGNERSARGFRPDRCLMVAQWHNDQGLVYCPAGALTQAELDLTEHFDTLSLTGLLPGKAVPVGETWKPGNGVVQALCNFEGLTAHDLTCKLVEVKNNVARISVTGTANGITLGVFAKLTVNGSCLFDVAGQHITSVEWQQKDERDQGPASPSATVQSTTTLTRVVIEEPKSLDDVSLVTVPEEFEPAASYTQLYHREPKGCYELLYGREWHTVGQTEEQLILRLMERGDFVAQVTLTPWNQAEPGKHMTGAEFQEEMAGTPGWEADQVLQVGEVPLDGGRWCYRISALGKLDDLKVMQNFYLVAGPQGEQVVLSFTMKQAMADKLGTRDLSLVGGLDFPSSQKPAPEEPKE